MSNPNHHVAIHGHFYQPPRDNPWLGVIEAQASAQPAHDWNERITNECYGPLTRSRLFDADGRVVDLFNCFAHLDFNIGPTLQNWLERTHPELSMRIRIGDDLHADARGGHHGALAQAYSHPILPLADTRDRHTQVVWGLRDFARRFGRPATGMWLPECGIDMNTIRTLIDHGVRFVILSPYQASAVRPFGRDTWKDVSATGGPDIRSPYRVFEVDGAGRTHFNRYLDVFFYDRELSIKISFDHLLSRPAELEALLFGRFDNNATLPQIVTIATDGEVYGHHHPHGEEMLARIFARLAPGHGVYVSNLEQYLAENPPASEVRLWFGPDDRGSSWSCEHGVGRWFRDCGCQAGGPDTWTQAWRTPLRDALNELHHAVGLIFAREGEKLFYDPWEARDDYIDVLLTPTDEQRAAFLARHATRTLTRAEALQAWELLEASRNAMLMFTSCGWFFSDLAGIEPIQNLRYALRAAERVQSYCDTDLEGQLAEALDKARSNLSHRGTGADVLRREVLPTRYTPRAVAASHVLMRLAGLPEPAYALQVTFLDEKTRVHAGKGSITHGRLQVRDLRTTRTWVFAFCGVLLTPQQAGVLFAEEDHAAFLSEMQSLSHEQLAKRLPQEGVRIRHLPAEDRERLLGVLLRQAHADLATEVHAVYDRAAVLLDTLAESNVPPPALMRGCAEHVLEDRFFAVVDAVADAGACTPEQRKQARAVLESAATHRLQINRFRATQRLAAVAEAQIAAYIESPMPKAVEHTLSLIGFAQESDIPLHADPKLQDAYWQFLHGPVQSVLAESDGEAARAALHRLGLALGFAPALLTDQLGG